MEALLFLIGVTANVISILVFCSPIKTFWRIVKNKSTEGFEPAPYAITLLSCSLWSYYGVSKPDGLLIVTVNGIGVAFEAIYVTLFLTFAAPPLRAKTCILVAILEVGVLGAVITATSLAFHGSTRLMVIGFLSAFLNVLMYGSPLMSMQTVIATRSVEYMPFLLSFFLFLNGGIWTIYAILDKDIFIGVPNGIGLFLGTIQLILYFYYMNSNSNEEGRPEEALLVPNGIEEQGEETDII
ncbi:bidirectional sugar transporter SWEET16-like isoform X1 [Typha angustifolia]|uniref:bidirectional sugar transporter SWEET16-like isoform X1 n=1 Tax=Typha angustifolia TaxID=59011 RepID=UPI003C2ED07F